MRKYLLFILFALGCCTFVLGQNNTTGSKTLQLTVDVNETHQTIDNFGAADAWSAQFVGGWPDVKRKAIADLLFSTENDNKGQPKGIGLSLWRFNLGAGSTQQGAESKIRDEWRRNPSFLDSSGRFNWELQGPQLWFLDAAKQRGVAQFVAFVNSPPVQYTKNHLAFSSDGKSNISKDQYAAFADYVAASMAGIRKKTGIGFDYVSPVNEPQWDWKDGSQEGSPYDNAEIAELSRVLGESLRKYKLSAKITVPEAGQLNYLIEHADKKSRGDQIGYFFENESTRLNQLDYMAPLVAGHSYFTTSPLSVSTKLREQLKGRIGKVKGLKYWMTEYSILGDNSGEIRGSKRDMGMDAALYIAKAIHQDLVHADAAAWQWWLAISPYDYKDGLVYVDKNRADGNFYPSKMLWAMGNFSRFIRPGARRIGLSEDSGSVENGFFSAYRNVLGKKELVVVLVNTGKEPLSFNLQVKGLTMRQWQPYLTADTASLAPLPAVRNGQQILVPARSVMTLLGNK